jgi:hypothetical protein
MAWVRLQVLMRPEHRTQPSVEAAATVAAALGMAPSGQGQTTFSARMSAPEFQRLFGRSASALTAKDAAADATPLPIPKELAEYVESVTVAPRHEYF